MNRAFNNKVCIVDDDPLVHFMTKKILKDFVQDDNVFSFSNGGEVLDFLVENLENEKKLPDIILLDINMPEVTGIEFLDKYTNIKAKLAKPIDIYIISSSMNKNEIYRAQNDTNTMGFITKPLTSKNLEMIFKI